MLSFLLHIFLCWVNSVVNLLLVSQAHGLQLEAFSLAIKKLDHNLPRPKLQFVGSCRNNLDEDRLKNLKERAADLGMGSDVEFYKNIKYR